MFQPIFITIMLLINQEELNGSKSNLVFKGVNMVGRSSASAQVIYESLRDTYKKLGLTKQELASELGLGLSTVSKMMADGMGLPHFKKLGTAKNSRVIFPIVDVAEFLADTIKVA